MSSVYASEPASSGSVLFETTHGPLQIHLWCRECPTATKLFLQLCMDGFYNDMVFHRIVDEFLIQTGAFRCADKPTAFTKEYQEKIGVSNAIERRKYETHSRLRFNHRGQVAMALGINDADDSELVPQFFITLDEAPYLDGKHVLFGGCTGPTFFNALRIGKMAVDDNNRPLDFENAPRVTGVKIVENPIHQSLAALAAVPWRTQVSVQKKKKKKRKGKKDLNVLSFGDEMHDINESGIQSSHDVISSKALSKSIDEKVKSAASEDGAKPICENKSSEKHPGFKLPTEVSELKTETKIREDLAPAKPDLKNSKHGINSPSDQSKNMRLEKPSQSSQPTSLSSKKSLVEARLARFKEKAPKSKRQREEDTMAKLLAFRSKVRKGVTKSKNDEQATSQRDDSLAARMARKADAAANPENKTQTRVQSYHGQILDNENDDEKEMSDWMSTKFKCRRHIDSNLRLENDGVGGDGRDIDEYEVIDGSYNGRQDSTKTHRHRHGQRRKHN